jgi:DNA replication protein DnaC
VLTKLGEMITNRGPSGTAKTYIAAGLCSDAVKNGYRAYFRTMDDIINILKLKDITCVGAAEYIRLFKAHLVAIDDIMLLPVTKTDAVAFFNFINQLYERASFIITTNKSPIEWTRFLMMKCWLPHCWTDYYINVRLLNSKGIVTE